MYEVGRDIEPGVYAGLVGTDVFDSCYWARLSDASGDFESIRANGNAVGQFYVEVQPDDRFFRVACEVTPLQDWPVPAELLSEIGPGIWLVGRDIQPGIYEGMAGTDVLDTCYWARLSDVSGGFSGLLANDNAAGRFLVEVQASDYALQTACPLRLTNR